MKKLFALSLVALSLALVTLAQGAGPPQKSDADLIKLMGDDEFRAREKASSDIIGRGVSALPALRTGLKSDDSEIRVRCSRAISAIERPLINKATARSMRPACYVNVQSWSPTSLSGFVIKSEKDKSYVITSSCGFDSGDPMMKVTVKYKGTDYEAKVEATDTAKHLILLSIEKGGLPVAKLADNAPKEGDNIWHVGCKDVAKPDLRWGSLGKEKDKKCPFNVNSEPGDAGAAIYNYNSDYHARVIGVLWGGSGDSGTSHVSTLEDLKGFLKDNLK